MKQFPIAMQVYSVRNQAEVNFAGTVRQIAEMGYDGVELAGLYGLSPQEVRKCLDQAGLTGISAHVGIEVFEKDLEGAVQAYQAIGCRYVGIPMLPRDRLPGGSRFGETLVLLSEISRALGERGMRLMYHNHYFEFQEKSNGINLLDALFAAASPDILAAEVDTCWAKVGGADPVACLEKYSGRIPVIHMKDCLPGDPVELVALGDGVVDVEGILRSAAAGGTQWLVVEQDDHPYGQPMENMKRSLDFLRHLTAQEDGGAM